MSDQIWNLILQSQNGLEKQKKFNCVFCDKSFTQKTVDMNHLLRHIEEKPYFCNICGASFSQAVVRNNHGTTHTKEKAHKCKLCGKSFSQAAGLNLHRKSHTNQISGPKNNLDENPYPVPQIQKVLEPNLSLQKIGNFPCIFCGKCFLNKNRQWNHILQHIEEKPFTCEICGKTFTQLGNRDTHLITHTLEKYYKCKVCGKSFNQSNNLRSHEKIHLPKKSRPFTCSICGAAFTRNSSLKAHVLGVHSGSRPYHCNECSKTFKYLFHLRKHERNSHQNAEPRHKCVVCVKVFQSKIDLENHILSHINEKHYSCQVCNETFTVSSSRKRHLRSVHSIVPEK